MSFTIVASPFPDAPPLFFLPGWGFDGRLVSFFELFPGRTVAAPHSFLDPGQIEADLLDFSRTQAGAIAIVGWSMGAQVGLSFSQAHPELVGSLTLVAMRQSWPSNDVAEIRRGLASDWRTYMRGFYRKCFLGYRDAYQRFASRLEDAYLADLSPDLLAAGLDYLETFRFSLRPDSPVPITVLHGRKDVVAPVAEMVQGPGVETEVVPHGGHMVLLDRMR